MMTSDGSRRIAGETEWSLLDLLKDILQRYMSPDSRLESMRLRGKLTMVRLRIHQIMKTRNITAYALSKGANISYPSAYRLSRIGGAFGRLHAETLDDLCRYFKVQPGKLLQWVP